MSSFNTDSYQGVGIDWLTVTLRKYDNHGGDKAMLLTKGSWDEVPIGLCVREHKLDLTRPDEITEKTRIKIIADSSQIF